MISSRWGSEIGEKVENDALSRFEELCHENAEDNKEVKNHTEKNIFPCISLYEALQKNGISQEDALTFLDETWSERAKAGASQLRKTLKIAGLYKLYPAMFHFVAKNQFGTKARFSAKFYDCGKHRCKFDMTKCLFLDTCRKYNCPELTQCFCHTDDINNADLHPRLCWNRTQYMGGGGEYCDFDIFVKK